MNKILLIAAAFAAVLETMGSATSQTYPSRPITMIVPFPAGGPSDVVPRILSDHLRATLGQSIIIENVSGAGGSIGMGRVARAAPGWIHRGRRKLEHGGRQRRDLQSQLRRREGFWSR